MPSLIVIKHFDVIKNIAAGFFPRSVDLFSLSVHASATGKSFLQPHYRGSNRDGSSGASAFDGVVHAADEARRKGCGW